jgi:hypothetical protein
VCNNGNGVVRNVARTKMKQRELNKDRSGERRRYASSLSGSVATSGEITDLTSDASEALYGLCCCQVYSCCRMMARAGQCSWHVMADSGIVRVVILHFIMCAIKHA